MKEIVNTEHVEVRNLYMELKERHQKEVNAFPMFFAFSDEQFDKCMKERGLDSTETDKLVSIAPGAFILKSDKAAYIEMADRQHAEFQAAINHEQTGEQFIFEMFDYELANHEYTYTYEVSDTLDALGFTTTDLENNPRLAEGLKKACKKQREAMDD